MTDYINQILNKEHSYSKEFIENNGISMFSFTEDNKFPIYYRGKVYRGDAINIDRMQSLENTESYLDNAENILHPKGDFIDFETYLENNKKVLSKAYHIITYCNEYNLLRIQHFIKNNTSLFRKYRVVQEMQLTALAIDCNADVKHCYEYQHQYCEVESGGGVVEIIQSGFIENKNTSYPETIVKKLSNFEGFAYLVLGAIVQYHIINNNFSDDCVLLTTLPFDINFEIWINGRYRDCLNLIQSNTTIPVKQAENITDDNCTSIVIVFLGRRFSLNINDLFGYIPKSICITVDIYSNHSEIYFTLEDTENKKNTAISLFDLLDYEVEDTI